MDENRVLSKLVRLVILKESVKMSVYGKRYELAFITDEGASLFITIRKSLKMNLRLPFNPSARLPLPD